LTGGGFESASGSAAVMLASKPVGNGWQCTPVNGSVDPISCFARCCGKTTSDSDDDGIVDADDYCVNTPANEVEEIDANGCGPSETTVSASYCANTPSDYVCNPSINFDDLLTNQSRDLVLLARQGISMPFTVPASTTTQGDFFYKSNNVILSGYLWKAWFSATPAGTALTSGGYCSISSRDPNGLSQDWSQVSANVFNCYLGQQRRVLYLNFGIFDESNALTYPANYFFSAQTILSNQ
jgi:hypothetical protein